MPPATRREAAPVAERGTAIDDPVTGGTVAPKNVLILGGTLFLGLHVARDLVARGHRVSLFTRDREPGDRDLGANRYVGDRDGDLSVLPRAGWDAVIDTSADVPSRAAASCAHLSHAHRYLYVSSVSVYDAREPETGDGLCAYVDLPEDAGDDHPAVFGAFKKRTEDVVRAVFGPERALIVRPGLIVGPNDPTNRFTYCVDRGAAGGTILAPGAPGDVVQFIDVRDLARFLVRLIEDDRRGIFDVTGRQGATTLGDVIAACARLAPRAPQIVWADGTWLEERGLDGWMDLPLWLAPKLGLPGLMNARIERALRHGLTFRTLEETVAATYAWSRAAPADRDRPAGITRERESELLAALSPPRSRAT